MPSVRSEALVEIQRRQRRRWAAMTSRHSPPTLSETLAPLPRPLRRQTTLSIRQRPPLPPSLPLATGETSAQALRGRKRRRRLRPRPRRLPRLLVNLAQRRWPCQRPTDSAQTSVTSRQPPAQRGRRRRETSATLAHSTPPPRPPPMPSVLSAALVQELRRRMASAALASLPTSPPTGLLLSRPLPLMVLPPTSGARSPQPRLLPLWRPLAPTFLLEPRASAWWRWTIFPSGGRWPLRWRASSTWASRQLAPTAHPLRAFVLC
mmetsp:Transcript_19762/g.75775  ORF Transcript_19762/g.75775 Transcript_19762/m.75775 type:complete len:263 (-) Transcript_19762:835-1623(-)